MEALDFARNYKRMCSSYYDCSNGCPLLKKRCLATGILTQDDDDLQTLVSAVEQWSEEHPIITNSAKFEEVFGFPLEDKFMPSTDVFKWLMKPYEEAKQ